MTIAIPGGLKWTASKELEAEILKWQREDLRRYAELLMACEEFMRGTEITVDDITD